MRESEARFRALTNLSSDWYWELDAEYRFSALGTLAHAFPDDVRATFRQWIDARTATA